MMAEYSVAAEPVEGRDSYLAANFLQHLACVVRGHHSRVDAAARNRGKMASRLNALAIDLRAATALGDDDVARRLGGGHGHP